MSARPRRLSKKLAGAALGLLAALVLAELGLRTAGWITLALSDRGGFSRDGDVTLLCIGDSNVFGLWEKPEESYPGQLQRILDEREPGTRYEVVNRGVPGRKSQELLDVLENELAKIRPDLVLVTIGANDTWAWQPAAGDETGEPPFWEDLRLVKVARLFLQRRREARGEPEREAPEGELARSPADEVRRRNLTRLHELLGDRLVLVGYASGEKIYGAASPILREVAAERGIPLVDPEPVVAKLTARVGFGEVYHPDHHPRALGYEVVARLVYDELVELGIAAGPPFEDPLANLSPHERFAAEVRLVGTLAGNDLAIEIEGEVPDREVVLTVLDVHRGGEDPPVRPYHEIWASDPILRWCVNSRAMTARLDERGRARIPLRPLLDRLAERGDPAGLRLRAGYLVMLDEPADEIDRFAEGVVVELR